MSKAATTSQPIDKLLFERWSPRAFNPQHQLSEEQMVSLAEAARWAPSCYGAEPWSFIFCPRQEQEAWDKALACLAGPNQAWAKNASLLIAALGQKNFEHNGEPNRHYLYDTGAAAFSLVTQSEALGLRAHQMGGFDKEAVVSSFGVPEGWDAIAMIAVGEQASADTLPEGKMRDNETDPRKRQPLGAKFFKGAWEASLA